MKYFLAIAALLFSSICLAQVPENTVWIDVRTPGEFEVDHLEGAHLIPYDGIETGILALNVEKDTPIYLYCAVGGRAGIARESLEKRGYTNVVNAGGLENARALAGAD